MAPHTTLPDRTNTVDRHDAPTLQRTTMVCGSTRYVVTGTLPPGTEAHLVDADGRAHVTDANTTTTTRPIAIAFLCAEPDLQLMLETS